MVTAKKKLHLCEKIGEQHIVGDVNEIGISIDTVNSANIYNDYMDKITKKFCYNCFNAENCKVCIFKIDNINSDNFVCPDFVGENIYKDKIKDLIVNIEKDQSLVMEVAIDFASRFDEKL